MLRAHTNVCPGEHKKGSGLLCSVAVLCFFSELGWIESSVALRPNELSQLRQFGPPTCKESDFCLSLEAVQVKSEYDTQKYIC